MKLNYSETLNVPLYRYKFYIHKLASTVPRKRQNQTWEGVGAPTSLPNFLLEMPFKSLAVIHLT